MDPKLKLDELSENADKISKRLHHVSQAVGPLRAEHTTLREELFHIRHTKNKYTDSDKASQAFLPPTVCNLVVFSLCAGST